MRELPIASPAHTWSVLKRIGRTRRRPAVAVILLYALAAASSMAAPVVLGAIVDRIDGISASTINLLAAAALGFVLLQTFLTWISRVHTRRLAEKVMRGLRDDFIADSMRLPVRRIEGASAGDLLTRATSDVAMLNRAAQFAVPEVLIAAVTVAVLAVGLAVINPLLALSLLVAVPITGAGGRWAFKRVRSVTLARGSAQSRLADAAASDVAGAGTVETYRLEEARRENLRANMDGTWRAVKREMNLRSVLFPSVDIGMILTVSAGVAVGAFLHSRDLATLGEVTTGVLLLKQISEPVAAMLIFGQGLLSASASLSRVTGVGEAGAAEPDDSDATGPGGDVEVDAVSYRYDDDSALVLHDVDLKVKEGETLAVVGASGAGKTSLARLVCGIDEPTSGRVRIGGADLSGLTTEARRRKVLMVTQEHHIFLGSVRDNLRLVDAPADDAKILAALEAVGAAEWVAGLPDGLDTAIGERDFPVGPAEAQRLALARVLLADPDVLVLDEATSLFAGGSARDMDRRLRESLRGKTVIAVAHNLSTAVSADRVAVMDAGRVVEAGTPDELRAADGDFARLWRAWNQEA
ncbi:ABC transporter ATP-binding protein [Salininema proteolyticum]|uniref:ABC transporter ATP-binding protein n=1 Tax=Salininema proteolyticum TaxID=1607685 RepID=A0ABV8TVW6_9ACTN